jgi:hypothetical protein
MRKISVGKTSVSKTFVGKTAPARTIFAAAALILYAGAAHSAPADLAAPPNATPLTVPVQNTYSGGYPYAPYSQERYYFSGWRPACPYRYHWECWGPYGAPACGCRPDPGLYTGY